MEKSINKDSAEVGSHLKRLVKLASFGGLFISTLGTGFAWAGSESFHSPSEIWKTSLLLNAFFFALTWLAYIPFRGTDRLIGNGVLALFLLLSFFWIFGFGGFYFYFLFAPMILSIRLTVLVIATSALAYHGFLISRDIKNAFHNKEKLFQRMYHEEGRCYTFERNSIARLQNARKDRNPFKSIHGIAAIIITPFILMLNKLLTPILGDGHGFFWIMAFFCLPMMLWGVELFVQTIMTMIYYPVKLERETGKPVLMKDW